MSSQPDNITIYSPGGTPLRNVSFDSNAEQVEDLMRADYVQLHWESTENTELPAGAYITFGGRKFTLLDPYSPEQADELQHTYTPQFQSRIMEWGKIPYFHYNQAGGSTTPEREPDWSLTANASTHLASVVAALAAEGQGTWTVEIDDYMQSQGATTISFQATDIFSGLNSIASAFEGEWWARENTSGVNGGKIYFARRIAWGTAIDLTVGSNVGVPSVTTSKEGYYNRFYVFGSTRNITQDYAGANVNALVNKRLTLDPAKYPGSYIDTRKDTKEPIFSRFLTFDDIYPRAHLNIPNTTLGLRARIMYRIDEATSLPKVIGTNSEGEPVYDQYVVWYFRPVVSDTGAEFTITDPTTYDPETNPTGELIKGKTLSVHFSSGLLNGREFELRFVDKNETLKGQSFPALGLSTPDFATYKGDFEIKYVEEGSMIVPTDISGGVHPQVGDVLTLFNLRMPASYVSSSQKDLEEAAQETIAERYDADLNNYTLPSNQVAFCKNDPGLTVGHAVRYTNGAYSYETRVIRIVRKLDTPNYCEQEITIGSEKIKGDRQTLREDVVDVNRNIEQLAALNSLTETIAQSYARAQQVMLDAIARSADIWKLDEDGNVYTERNVYSCKDVAAGGKSDGLGGAGGMGGALNLFDLLDVELSDRVNGDLIAWNGAKWTNIRQSDITPDLTGYATETWVKAQGYLTQHQSLAGYATQTWVEGKGYALASDLGGYLPLIGGTLTGPLTMGGAGVHRIYFKDAEHFIELDEDGSFHFSHDIYGDGDIVAGGWQTPGEGEVPVVAALSDLTDVKLAGLAIGDLLQWNGTDWVNVKASELGISGSVDLSNYVTIDTAQEIKGAKTFNGSNYILSVNDPSDTNINAFIGYQGNGANKAFTGYIGSYAAIGISGGARIGVTDTGTPIYAASASSTKYMLLHTGNMLLAPDATFSSYVTAIKTFIAVRIGSSTSYGAMRAFDVALDVGNGDFSRFFRLMHNRVDGNLRFQGSIEASPGGWATERTLLDTVNYASLIDARYVKKSGDTMTGALTIGTQRSGAAGANKTWLIIHPVYHTGGPWYINSYDTDSTAYFRIMYGTIASFTLSHSGEITTPGNIKSVRTGAASQVVASRDGRAVSLHSDSNRGVYDNSGSGWLIGTNGTNTFLMRGNVGIGKTDPGYSLDANGQIRANGWLRTIGNVGWYNETHGGGWFMQDSTWVRTYNSKAVYTGSGRIRSDHLFDRQGYAGTSWNAGYGAYNIAIVNNSNQTPLLLAYRSGVEPMNATGANRLFSMEFLNAGTALRLYFGGVQRFIFYSNGNFESSGDQIVGSSSDRRLKQRFSVENYASRIMRLGAVMDYEWSEKARTLDPGKYDAVRHSSVVWQRARKVGIPGFCGADDRGYGFVNWLNKDYQAVLLGAVQETIRTVYRHDDEIRRLRRRICELEGIVNNKCA